MAGFQAGEIQEIIDHPQKTFRVFPRRHQQFELFWIERPDSLLQQKVKSHANARQRSFQLVADGRDQVRLHLVHETEPGYILQNQGRSEHVSRLVTHSDDPGEQKGLVIVNPNRNCLFKACRHTIRGSFQDLSNLLLDREREPVLAVKLLDKFPGRRIGKIDFPSSESARIASGNAEKVISVMWRACDNWSVVT